MGVPLVNHGLQHYGEGLDSLLLSLDFQEEYPQEGER